ncbi:MAG: 50S ribosomal protein L23 [Fibrobacterota bacterium]
MVSRDILQSPLLTEKNNHFRVLRNVYAFKVHPDANKVEIKKAVEEVFGVKVQGVRTQNVLGKIKRQGKNIGRRSSWKKAIVTLKQGSVIPIFEGA